MSNPKPFYVVFNDNDEFGERVEKPMYWVDIESNEGGLCNAAISGARNKKTALIRAMKKLRKIADEIEKDIDRI